MEYEGNRRFVSNEDQKRCKNCGLFVSPTEVDTGVLKYDCDRCGVTYEPVKISLRSLEASTGT